MKQPVCVVYSHDVDVAKYGDIGNAPFIQDYILKDLSPYTCSSNFMDCDSLLSYPEIFASALASRGYAVRYNFFKERAVANLVETKEAELASLTALSMALIVGASVISYVLGCAARKSSVGKAAVSAGRGSRRSVNLYVIPPLVATIVITLLAFYVSSTVVPKLPSSLQHLANLSISASIAVAVADTIIFGVTAIGAFTREC